MNTRLRETLRWFLLIGGFVAGMVAWVGKKNEKLSAVLVASAYAAILIYGLFFKSKEELRRE